MNNSTYPDIEKLRRFSLAFALILITYAIAGIKIDSPAKISPFGIPLIIARPDLLGLGLIFGSLYGLLRFLYYGVLIGTSPRLARKRILSGNLVDTSLQPKGITEFMSQIKKDIDMYFPKFFIKNKHILLKCTQLGDNYNATISVPARVRLFAYIQDIDFFAPIWLNLIAISFYFYFQN